MSTSKPNTTSPASTVVEDHLDVDPQIPGQQFVCLSFVSPEKILPQKEAFFRKAFWAFLKERHEEIDYTIVKDFETLYDTFLAEHEQDLEDKFHEENQFRTTIRGLKIRGTYNTKKEAEIRAKVLQKIDRSHHVFVAPVGYWLPWDPAADAVQDQVYQEEELNELMKNYKQNEMKRDTFYEEQKQERKKAALEENERRRAENRRQQELETAELAGAPIDGTAGSAGTAEEVLNNVAEAMDHIARKQAVAAEQQQEQAL
jgi:hypothetical protein